MRFKFKTSLAVALTVAACLTGLWQVCFHRVPLNLVRTKKEEGKEERMGREDDVNKRW